MSDPKNVDLTIEVDRVVKGFALAEKGLKKIADEMYRVGNDKGAADAMRVLSELVGVHANALFGEAEHKASDPTRRGGR